MPALPDSVEPAPDERPDTEPVNPSPLVTLGSDAAPVCTDGVCVL
ncbi:hypothetical protein EDD27_2716 [Nonomuraea polychroma]|uniref:Uncharacterized protein n=1 Tax=Nonomuraea polychroma TaxID=46176 RepID=A0A438M3U3_9ACTN|nr:hypothetical protein [Nonomuraea polychroma]RVX40311.1 hypothetical protein EDD27_2716 [Nonomuraea polychroma]